MDVVVDRVRKPMNAFIVFSQMERLKLIRRPACCRRGMLSTDLGRRWTAMNSEQRRPYKEQADRLKLMHQLKYPNNNNKCRRPNKRVSSTSYSTTSSLPPSSPHTRAVVDCKFECKYCGHLNDDDSTVYRQNVAAKQKSRNSDVWNNDFKSIFNSSRSPVKFHLIRKTNENVNSLDVTAEKFPYRVYLGPDKASFNIVTKDKLGTGIIKKVLTEISMENARVATASSDRPPAGKKTSKSSSTKMNYSTTTTDVKRSGKNVVRKSGLSRDFTTTTTDSTKPLLNLTAHMTTEVDFLSFPSNSDNSINDNSCYSEYCSANSEDYNNLLVNGDRFFASSVVNAEEDGDGCYCDGRLVENSLYDDLFSSQYSSDYSSNKNNNSQYCSSTLLAADSDDDSGLKADLPSSADDTLSLFTELDVNHYDNLINFVDNDFDSHRPSSVLNTEEL